MGGGEYFLRFLGSGAGDDLRGDGDAGESDFVGDASAGDTDSEVGVRLGVVAEKFGGLEGTLMMGRE